ncbi:hypothetical protein IHE44_0009234, partial [Lamprotornis superbus]
MATKAAHSCSSVTPGEDGNSPAGDARQWPRNNIDGKEMAHGQAAAHQAPHWPPFPQAEVAEHVQQHSRDGDMAL